MTPITEPEGEPAMNWNWIWEHYRELTSTALRRALDECRQHHTRTVAGLDPHTGPMAKHGDTFPNGWGCPCCDGTGFVSDEIADRLRLTDSFPPDRTVVIWINRAKYVIPRSSVTTGSELRYVPTPAITSDYDLWKIEPGADDRLIGTEDAVTLSDGMRFFTAPSSINAGALRSSEVPSDAR